ncbi:MAG: glycosyltransferase [Firmicutes bacterium]|nr:glycosyltransferase [Bacillota bacterium]
MVSLVLVVENAEEVVEDALRRAVLRYGWWSGDTWAYELVVVDIGSSDDTPAIVERFARRHPEFIRLVRVAAGTTAARALALAAPACRGETMVTLDLSSLVGKRRQAPRQETGTT